MEDCWFDSDKQKNSVSVQFVQFRIGANQQELTVRSSLLGVCRLRCGFSGLPHVLDHHVLDVLQEFVPTATL